LSRRIRRRRRAWNVSPRRKSNSTSALSESIVDGLSAIIVEGRDAGDVIANLAKQLASAALKAALLGSGLSLASSAERRPRAPEALREAS
jgi:hypothetical protein